MFVYILDLVGTLAFAVAGAYKAKTRQLNMFGAIVCGWATAVGGGTFRDLVIGRTPLFYLKDSKYLVIIIVASIVTFYLPKLFKNLYSVFRLADTLGLGVFLATGVLITQEHLFKGEPVTLIYLIVCTFLGMITGFGGGILRDSIIGVEPFCLRGGSNYVLSSFLGSLSFLLLSLQTDKNLALAVSFTIVVIMREIVSPHGLWKKVLKPQRG